MIITRRKMPPSPGCIGELQALPAASLVETQAGVKSPEKILYPGMKMFL